MNLKHTECFPGDSTVVTRERGEVLLRNLKIGEHIRTYENAKLNSSFLFTEVLNFLDEEHNIARSYIRFDTIDGLFVEATPSHLIYVVNNKNRERIIYAKDIRTGYRLISVKMKDNKILKTNSEVISITRTWKQGAFAPLTSKGTLLVNSILVSCYAKVEDHRTAHLSFSPMRFIHQFLPISVRKDIYRRYADWLFHLNSYFRFVEMV